MAQRMLQLPNVRDSTIETYCHYSGFIVKASEFHAIKGIIQFEKLFNLKIF